MPAPKRKPTPKPTTRKRARPATAHDVQVVDITITDLRPDIHNANAGTVRGLAMLEDSMSKYGAGRGILADKHGNVIAGNKTLQAAVDAGLKVKVVQTDGSELVVTQRTDLDLYTDNRARELAYADNRVAEIDLAWNAEALLADMAAGVDLSAMFDQDELDAILASLDTDEPPADPAAQMDKAAELQKVWNVKRGDLWLIGNHRLLCGDSTDPADVARVMGGERAALVVTDPPYGVEYADKNKFLNAIARGNRIQTPIAGDHGTKDETQAMWKAAFKEMAEVMMPGAVVYCFMPQGGDQMMMMMMMMMMGAGIEPRHELIWLKNNHVLGRTDYSYKHEPILYAWKEGGHKFYGDFQTSVIECDRPQSSDLHPTTKPTELIVKLIENSSLSADIVLDIFSGSGTSLVACEQTHRRGRAIEIEPKYVAVALDRLARMGLSPERET